MRVPRSSSILATVLLLVSCINTPPDRFVDLSVDDVVTIGWSEGGGVYRVIRRNTDVDPCLTVESIVHSNVTSDVRLSTQLCTMQTEERTYNLTNTAHFGYENIRWENRAFRLRLAYMPRAGAAEELFDCQIEDLETKPWLECVRAE